MQFKNTQLLVLMQVNTKGTNPRRIFCAISDEPIADFMQFKCEEQLKIGYSMQLVYWTYDFDAV